MFHWCSDETLAAMSVVPVVGALFRKAHKWYHQKTHHKCHQPGCEAEHLHHDHEEHLMPNPPARDVISMEEVDQRFGQLATIFLMFDRKLLGTNFFPATNEFVWFLSSDDTLSARWKNEFFLWDGKDWKPEFEKVKEEEFTFEDILGVVRSFVASEKVYHSMLNWQPTEAFIKAEKILQQIDGHENIGSNNPGLDQEQETNSGSPQSDQETN